MVFSSYRLLKPLRRAFAWWVSELKAMLPARLRRVVASSAPEYAVDVERDGVIVRALTANGERELGRLQFAGLSAEVRRAQLAVLLAPGDLRAPREAVLRLPATRILRKRVELPAAAAENLREVLSIDLDRQTPFTAEQVYFDFTEPDIDRKSGRLHVDLVVATRQQVDAGIEVVRDLGLLPRQVTVNWPRGDGPRVNLLPAAAAQARPKFVSALNLALVTLAIALAIAAVVIPLQQREAVAAELAQRVSEQRKRADATQRLAAEIDQLTRQSRFLVNRRAQRPLAVDILAELTRVVPDDTWIFRLRTTGREVQVFGYSTAATALIGLIEQSPLFEDSQFRAPLTRDPRTEAERFHIGFRVRDRVQS
jgi:general secretion pathway protein L